MSNFLITVKIKGTSIERNKILNNVSRDHAREIAFNIQRELYLIWQDYFKLKTFQDFLRESKNKDIAAEQYISHIHQKTDYEIREIYDKTTFCHSCGTRIGEIDKTNNHCYICGNNIKKEEEK